MAPSIQATVFQWTHPMRVSSYHHQELALGSRICCNCRGKGQRKCRNMFLMVARERASEGCLAGWRRRSLPRTMVYVSPAIVRGREPQSIIALPEEKPVDTNKTGDTHMATQIVLYVSGRTTDVSRTVPIYESYTLYVSGRTTDVSRTVPIYESYTLYVSGRTTDVSRTSAHLRKLHSVRFGTHDGRVAHSAHLRKLHSVRFGTHDGRVAHSAHLRKLHSVRFGDARRTCRAQCPSTKVTLCIAPSSLGWP